MDPIVDQLTEELTCQEVMLGSLEGEAHDGVEDEREEIRRDMARLNRLLEKAKRGEDAVEDEVENAPEEGIVATGSQIIRPQPRHETPVRSLVNDGGDPEAAPSGQYQATMATPQAREAWSDTGSISLPSRKRERTMANSHDPRSLNKSRRTTPTPMASQPFDSPERGGHSSEMDFIDLTGPDASFLTQSSRRRQGDQDRQLAIQLSSQSSSSETSRSPSGQSNAFDRMMHTQYLNTGPSGRPSSPSASPGLQGDDPFGVGRSSAMPGTYHSSWDGPNSSGPNNVLPNAGPGRYGGRTLPTPQPPTFGTPNGMGPIGGGISLPSMGDMGLSSVANMPIPGQAPPPLGVPGAPSGFGVAQGSPYPVQGLLGGLSSVIQRTSQFDFTNGTDGFGNPFPERLTNYLQDAMHDSRVSEQELDDLLQNIRPDMDIPEMNRGETPEGLKGTLYRHQELALTWSTQMEEGSNKGGILADDMGLGKTISMISLMLTRKPTSRPKTTLIVAPLALLRQWEEEIRTKVKPSHRLSTFIYHQRRSTTEELLRYDVVLTTYGTLAAELKRLDALLVEDRERRVDFNDKTVAVKCPLLHPTKAVFYRIILDEAQCIKNKTTQTAKAAFQLRSTYRWCLTGTPMMNGVVELFSLIHFLRIRPYCQWDQFTGAFGRLFGRRGEPKSTAMRRLRALLKAIMLRRKKDSELDGKPIIRLPPKSEEEVHVELSADERDFYNTLENRSRVLFNKYLREGTVGKNYSNILVLLLRLRQTCCHPHLNMDVEDSPSRVVMTDDQMEQLVRGLVPSIVNRIKEIEAFECPICYDAIPSPSFFVPCGHDSCQECLAKVSDAARISGIQQGNEGSGAARCPVCRSNFDPEKCFTYEAFRKIHMPETIQEGEADDTGSGSDDGSETESDTESEPESESDDVDKKGNLRDFIVYDDFDDDEEDQSERPPKAEASSSANALKTKKKKPKKNKGKDKAADVKSHMLRSLRKEAPKNRTAFKKYMAYLRKTYLPSAKVEECMRLLKSIQETSDEKTIIFSQWTLLLDLVEVAMHHEGFKKKPQRYDGSMSATQRNNAATAFRTNPEVNVILVSLRAGNAGLNLTAASRVIILDPFWNPYIEMQAIDRAYRIGQQRDVKVYRILTQETVEDRIIELQNKKKEMVEAALDESESRKIGRLSTNELKFLFNSRDD